ncbi:MAG: hypothetical protein JW891_03810 [Candidatus Lokiarchaeota archaeon]|nr:hypothetical protein [Candidatus Lokiarchaeota archaeon]
MSYYLCLECGKRFKNSLEIAVCPDCLKIEEENHKKGISSKYTTINLLLNNEKL